MNTLKDVGLATGVQSQDRLGQSVMRRLLRTV